MQYKSSLRLVLPLMIAASLGLVAREGRATDGHVAPTAVHAGGPLAAWMTGNATPALASTDFPRLARAFEHIAQVAPRRAGFEKWTPIARDGLAAAARHDVEGARRACKACHDSMRAEYKNLPPADR